MKKQLFILLIGLNFGLKAQNIFPTSGNVGIGTSTPHLNSRLHILKGISGGTPHIYSSLTVESSGHSMISILTANHRTGFFGFSDSEDDYVGV